MVTRERCRALKRLFVIANILVLAGCNTRVHVPAPEPIVSSTEAANRPRATIQSLYERAPSITEAFVGCGKLDGIAVPELSSGTFSGYIPCGANRIARYAAVPAPVETYWFGEKCTNNKVDGYGYLLVCAAGIDCRYESTPVLIAAVNARRGDASVCPLMLNDRDQRFRGELYPNGAYKLGILIRTPLAQGGRVQGEEFVGLFRKDRPNVFMSGFVRFKGAIYMSESFNLESLLDGETVVITEGAEGYLADCRGFTCTKKDAPIRLNASEVQYVERNFLRGMACGIEKRAVETLIRMVVRVGAGWPSALLSVAVDNAISSVC